MEQFRNCAERWRSQAPNHRHPEKLRRRVSVGTIDELHALGYLGSADARSATDVSRTLLLPDPKDKIAEQNLLHTAMMASENGEPNKARVALERCCNWTKARRSLLDNWASLRWPPEITPKLRLFSTVARCAPE